MKLKKYLPFIGTAFLAYLAFVDNIAVNLGDDNTFITQEEFFEKNNPSVNDFTNQEKEEECHSFVDLADYADFLAESSFDNFHFKSNLLLDTTGDGEKEVVKSSVQLENNTCLVNQEIIKNGESIWHESFAFTRADLPFYFGKMALSDDESEKALFYLGMSHAKFTEQMTSPEGFPKRLQQLTSSFYRDSNLLEKDMLNTGFLKELREYKGHYIFKRHASNLAIYMWDKTNKQFIEVFTPESAV